MEVGSPSRLTDRSEVFLPESSWRVSNLSAQFPGEAMPSRAPHALILTARRGAGQVSQTLVSGHIAWVSSRTPPSWLGRGGVQPARPPE
jgi:hypothetical protein